MRDSFESRFNVSRETLDCLDAYEALLKKWNPKINLVSKSTLHGVWQRHFADSAQLWAHLPNTADLWLDFGSGAGFPGLVCAVLAKEFRPELRFILVESDHRKCAFLINVVRELGLNVIVESRRIEDVAPLRADIISARAVASLDLLLSLSEKHAHESTVLLFPKGISYESELTTARKHWHIEPKIIRSLTDSNSVILRIEGFERANN